MVVLVNRSSNLSRPCLKVKLQVECGTVSISKSIVSDQIRSDQITCQANNSPAVLRTASGNWLWLWLDHCPSLQNGPTSIGLHPLCFLSSSAYIVFQHGGERLPFFPQRPGPAASELIKTPQLCHRYNPVTDRITDRLGNPTCLMDVIFLPIPAIILAVLLVLAALRPGGRHSTSINEKGSLGNSTVRPTRFKIFLYYLDIALAFCQGGMQVLEITRLAISEEGVGLLPGSHDSLGILEVRA